MQGIITKIVVLVASAFVLGAAQPTIITSVDLLPTEAEAGWDNGTYAGEYHTIAKRDGKLNCGNFASGNRDMGLTLLNNINNNNKAHIPAHSCHRMQCKDTTAIYVCNNNAHALDMTSRDVYNRGINIVNKCCVARTDTYYVINTPYTPIGGQQWTDALGGNWNVIMGYGNCNHPSSQPPNEVGGWGVNGKGCARTSMCIGKC